MLIILYHVFSLIFVDKKRENIIKHFKDPENVVLEDLKERPLVNIIIPAWKEGKEFKECLKSVVNLQYPHIKVIVNAGGDQETINIARKFRKYDNFIILKQEGGKSRAAFGKIKALNESIDYVNEGILYFIDADCYLTDEILLRMIYPIINKNQHIVISTFRPLKSQESSDLVNYLQISRVQHFKGTIFRYNQEMVSGSNTCTTYETIKEIGKFNENRFISEDVSRGIDFLSKGFNIFSLFDYRSRIYSAYPNSINEYYEQRKRHIENSLLISYKNRNFGYTLKFFMMLLISLYLLLIPFLIFLHFGSAILGFFILLHLYLIKIRKYIFFRRTVNRKFYGSFRNILFIKILFYIYIDIIINILILFDLIPFVKKLKKESSN
jgi:glycosyltransferase involved in cell wall biosynthesis